MLPQMRQWQQSHYHATLYGDRTAPQRGEELRDMSPCRYHDLHVPPAPHPEVRRGDRVDQDVAVEGGGPDVAKAPQRRHRVARDQGLAKQEHQHRRQGAGDRLSLPPATTEAWVVRPVVVLAMIQMPTGSRARHRS
eukprot:4395532-Pyramimonas_sp.AAC.1